MLPRRALRSPAPQRPSGARGSPRHYTKRLAGSRRPTQYQRPASWLRHPPGASLYRIVCGMPRVAILNPPCRFRGGRGTQRDGLAEQARHTRRGEGRLTARASAIFRPRIPSGLLATTVLLAAAARGEAQAPPPVAPRTVVTCSETADPSLTGLAGVVRDTLQGLVIPGALVSAIWADESGARRTLSVDADQNGVYVLCGLPSMTRLSVTAQFPSFRTDPVGITIEPGPPAGWDILVAVEEGELSRLLTLPGRILGRVIDQRTGRPVRGAAISLIDTLLNEGRERVTDGGGRFAFADLKPGMYRVSVAHMGFGSADELLHLPSDRTVQLDFELSVDPIRQAPIVVTVVRDKRLELQGFYDRREHGEAIGAGVYLTREDILDAGAIRVTHYLGRIPGVRIECGGGGSNNCTVRMTRGVPSLSSRAEYGCMNANVYVDGVRVIRDGGASSASIDNFVSTAEIAGIEVYRGPSELPAEFGGAVGRCGAIVIWTGPAIR